jgi:hypothetical protein
MYAYNKWHVCVSVRVCVFVCVCVRVCACVFLCASVQTASTACADVDVPMVPVAGLLKVSAQMPKRHI